MIRDFRAVWGDLDLTSAPYLFEFGHDTGSPETLYEVRQGLFGSGGSAVTSTGTGNREMSFVVYVEGADSVERADAERALVLQGDKPMSSLALTNADGWSAPAVFDTFRAQIVHEQSEESDAAGMWRYVVTLPALSYPRSQELTITPALPTPPETVIDDVIDTCTEPSGWVTKYGGPPTEPVEGWLATSGFSPAMTRLGPIDLSERPYLTITTALTPESWEPNLQISGITYRPLMRLPDIQGWEHITYQIDQNVPTAGFAITTYSTIDQTLMVNTVKASSHPPVVGTRRQALRAIEVGGAVPTTGSIHVDASSGSLADALIYTWPRSLGNYSPVLSPYWATGPALVPDENAVSGAYRNISDGAASVLIPADALPPGDYTLAMRVKTTAAAGYRRVDVTTRSYVSSVAIGSPITKKPSVYVPTGLIYRTVVLGRFTLPPTRMGSAGLAQIVIEKGAGETAPLYVDELYAFHTSGALSMFETHPSTHLWIDAPNLAEPEGAIWAGNAADGSDKWFAGWISQFWDEHTFDPEGMNLLTVTPGAVDAKVDLTHYRRWHSNVAEGAL